MFYYPTILYKNVFYYFLNNNKKYIFFFYQITFLIFQICFYCFKTQNVEIIKEYMLQCLYIF